MLSLRDVLRTPYRAALASGWCGHLTDARGLSVWGEVRSQGVHLAPIRGRAADSSGQVRSPVTSRTPRIARGVLFFEVSAVAHAMARTSGATRLASSSGDDAVQREHRVLCGVHCPLVSGRDRRARAARGLRRDGHDELAGFRGSPGSTASTPTSLRSNDLPLIRPINRHLGHLPHPRGSYMRRFYARLAQAARPACTGLARRPEGRVSAV